MPIARTLTSTDLLAKHPPGERGAAFPYKWVRVVGPKGTDVYRFAEVAYFCPDHRHMVDENEQVVSAGSLRLAPDKWEFLGHSMTLKIGAASDDEDLFTELFRRPYERR